MRRCGEEWGCVWAQPDTSELWMRLVHWLVLQPPHTCPGQRTGQRWSQHPPVPLGGHERLICRVALLSWGNDANLGLTSITNQFVRKLMDQYKYHVKRIISTVFSPKHSQRPSWVADISCGIFRISNKPFTECVKSRCPYATGNTRQYHCCPTATLLKKQSSMHRTDMAQNTAATAAMSQSRNNNINNMSNMSLKLSQIPPELRCLFSVYIYHDVGVLLVIGRILSNTWKVPHSLI